MLLLTLHSKQLVFINSFYHKEQKISEKPSVLYFFTWCFSSQKRKILTSLTLEGKSSLLKMQQNRQKCISKLQYLKHFFLFREIYCGQNLWKYNPKILKTGTVFCFGKFKYGLQINRSIYHQLLVDKYDIVEYTFAAYASMRAFLDYHSHCRF